MKMRVAIFPIAAIAVMAAVISAAESNCGFCDDGFDDACILNNAHEFWATIEYHAAAHDGFHVTMDCGSCGDHKTCSSGQAAIDIEEALNGERALDVTLMAHAGAITLRESASALDVADCSGTGDLYAFRLTPEQVEVARGVLVQEVALSD